MTQKEWNKFQKDVLMPHYEFSEICWCENCGKNSALSFHHLIRRSQGGENDVNNIMLLCYQCHHRADNGADNVEFTEKLIGLAKQRSWQNFEYFEQKSR